MGGHVLPPELSREHAAMAQLAGLSPGSLSYARAAAMVTSTAGAILLIGINNNCIYVMNLGRKP